MLLCQNDYEKYVFSYDKDGDINSIYYEEIFDFDHYYTKEEIEEKKDKYFEVLNDIKKTLIITRNRIIENVNKDLILMYYNIGLKLIENKKWGSSFIDNLAKDLKMEFPTLKGMSARNLRYMQKFAAEFDNDEFLQHDVAKLP